MNDDYELEHSNHCGPMKRDGRSIQVEIYRGKGINSGINRVRLD